MSKIGMFEKIEKVGIIGIIKKSYNEKFYGF